MGIRGDENTRLSNQIAELLVKNLTDVRGITSKKMFGGYGIFHEGKMFGIINSKGDSFFKVDDSNKADYEKFNSEQHSRMPYFSIPYEIIKNN